MFRCFHATVLLTALVAAGAATGSKAAPAPELTILDTFQYTYMSSPLEDRALLSVTRDGKVTYFYQSAPGTDSGGITVAKKWEITKSDAVALLDGLVKDGLLKMKDADRKNNWKHRVAVRSGSRELVITPKELPDKVFARLLPLLQKAHPEAWKAKLPK